MIFFTIKRPSPEPSVCSFVTPFALYHPIFLYFFMKDPFSTYKNSVAFFCYFLTKPNHFGWAFLMEMFKITDMPIVHSLRFVNISPFDTLLSEIFSIIFWKAGICDELPGQKHGFNILESRVRAFENLKDLCFLLHEISCDAFKFNHVQSRAQSRSAYSGMRSWLLSES